MKQRLKLCSKLRSKQQPEEEAANRLTAKEFLALTAAMYKLLLPKLLIVFGVLILVGLLLKLYLR